MFIQTRLGTLGITPNDNICFPVGTIFAVCGQYEKLGFPDIFGKYKKKGMDLFEIMKQFEMETANPPSLFHE